MGKYNKMTNKKDKKLKIARTQQNTEGALDGLSVPAPLVIPVVFLMSKIMCQIILCDMA